jgi:hypothetical protein
MAAVLGGCDRGQVQEYRVPREEPPMQQPAAPSGHSDASVAPAPALEYQRPPGWQEAPLGQMRVASFEVSGKDGKGAEVSVVPLPDPAGTDLNNVNRWRSQVGLPPVPEAELAGLAQPVEIAGQPAKLYEQAGTSAGATGPSRILAAIIRRDGVAWFFKLAGDDGLVAEQRSAFIEFLRSVRFPAEDPAGQPQPSPVR